MNFSIIKEQFKNMKSLWIICGLILFGVYVFPYVYNQFPSTRWMFDDMKNPYMTIEQLNAVDPEYRELWIKNMNQSGHDLTAMNYKILPNGKIEPLTLLNEDGIKIQSEHGCSTIECHTKQ